MYWYDVREGKLVVGEAAYEQAVENSEPGDLRTLSDVVLAKTIDFSTNTYEKLHTKNWSEDDYIAYGRWVISVLSEDDNYEGLKRDNIDRLRALGLGPSRQPLLQSVGPRFTDYLTRLGEPPYDRLTDHYENWQRRDYASYAANLAEQLRKPATYDDFTAASQRGEGPSPWIMTKNMGTPGAINELIGYPNVYFWEREDFIAWGAQAIAINNGAQLTHRMITMLSKRGRGPGFGTVKDEFGTLSEFQRLANERYQSDPTSKIPRENAAYNKLEIMWEAKIVNQRQVEYITESHIDIVEFTAKYDVLVDLLPDIDRQHLSDVALEPTDDFVDYLTRLGQDIQLEDIQLSAIATKHTDDIWSLSERWKADLRVTKYQLNYKHQANREKYGPTANDDEDQTMCKNTEL